MDKTTIINLVRDINSTDSKEGRKVKCDELRAKVSSLFNEIDKIWYEEGWVYDKYINFDSCCGFTIVEATYGMEPLVDFLVENEGKSEDQITMSDAAFCLTEFGERSEWSDDIIDDDFFVGDWRSPEELADELWDLLSTENNGEEKFKRDIEFYLAEKAA